MTQPMLRQPAPFVLANDDAPAYWKNSTLWLILAAADQTMGVFSMIEQLMPVGSGPPTHVHERSHEVFYILEGEIKFQVEDQVIEAGRGATVWIPPGTPHSFLVTSKTARALNMYTPGGFDDNISLLGTPATSHTLPPAGTVKQATSEREQAYLLRLSNLHVQTWLETPSLQTDDD